MTAALLCAVAAPAILALWDGSSAFAQTGGYKGLTAAPQSHGQNGAPRQQGQSQQPGYSGYKGLVAPRGTPAPQQQAKPPAQTAEDPRGQRIGAAPVSGGGATGSRLPVAVPRQLPAEQQSIEMAQEEKHRKDVHKDLKTASVVNSNEIFARIAQSNPLLQDILAHRQKTQAEKNSLLKLANLNAHTVYEKTDNGGYYEKMSGLEQGIYPRLDAIMKLVKSGDFTDENGRRPDPKERREILKEAKKKLEDYAQIADGNSDAGFPSVAASPNLRGAERQAAEQRFRERSKALGRIAKEAKFVANEIGKNI